MLKFSSFEQLSESKLTFGEIVRDDRAFRLELFLRKYKGNEPFELTDGSQVTLQYDAAIERALKAGDAKTGNKIGLMTNTGQKIAFGSLAKTKEFGGGRGSGGGSDNTRATESAQCVYLQAVWDDPTTKFSPDSLRDAYKKTFTDASPEEVMLGDNNWIGSSIAIAKLIHRVLKKQGTYSFHRGSDWVNTLENKFKELNRAEKLFQNVNKWTPADIWMIKSGKEGAYDIAGCGSIKDLNQVLLRAYQARDIIGVSLKNASQRPRLTQVNYKKPFKPPVFQSVSYNKRGTSSSQRTDTSLVVVVLRFSSAPSPRSSVRLSVKRQNTVRYPTVGSTLHSMRLLVTRLRTERFWRRRSRETVKGSWISSMDSIPVR